MSPRSCGLIAAVCIAIGHFVIGEYLGVQPDRPIACRTDVFFQSDAGGIVQDAVINFSERARGVHPAVYPLWTRPLHALTHRLAPDIRPAATATYASRSLVNIGCGIGVGVLVAMLRHRGVSLGSLAIFVALSILASGHTLAAIPDHFGLSVGALAACFATYLSPASPRTRLLILCGLSSVVTAITITNILFPLLLIVAIAACEMSVPKWVYAAAVLIAMLAGAVAIIGYHRIPGMKARIDERVQLYLTWTLTRDPLTAGKMAFRGVVDSVVAPEPDVELDANLEGLPMLTYQPRDEGYSYCVGALAWLILLTGCMIATLRKPSTRRPTLLLLIWYAWNAIFHTIWGDEYFLYTPHYAWCFITITALGAQSLSRWIVWPLLAITIIGSILTLKDYHDALAAIFA
jgi:hypothetical protein